MVDIPRVVPIGGLTVSMKGVRPGYTGTALPFGSRTRVPPLLLLLPLPSPPPQEEEEEEEEEEERRVIVVIEQNQ